MKFTSKEDFKVERLTFKAVNTYDSTKYGLSDNQVNSFYNAGWCEVEGKEAAPERKPGAQAIVVETSTHG